MNHTFASKQSSYVPLAAMQLLNPKQRLQECIITVYDLHIMQGQLSVLT